MTPEEFVELLRAKYRAMRAELGPIETRVGELASAVEESTRLLERRAEILQSGMGGLRQVRFDLAFALLELEKCHD